METSLSLGRNMSPTASLSKLVYPHGVDHTLARGTMGLTGVEPEPSAAVIAQEGETR